MKPSSNTKVSNLYQYYQLSLHLFRIKFFLDIHSLSPFADRKPGDIEAITDLFFEDFLNFPTTLELREESANFVREEMERTWGSQHLAVFSEDEAQKWLLGVHPCSITQ